MSKGSPIVPLRIPAELLAAIDADVERSIQCDQHPRSTRTAWILSAVLEVLRHRERAKKSRGRRRAARLDRELRDAGAARLMAEIGLEE